MTLSFLLAMFALPAAIILTAIILAVWTREKRL